MVVANEHTAKLVQILRIFDMPIRSKIYPMLNIDFAHCCNLYINIICENPVAHVVGGKRSFFIKNSNFHLNPKNNSLCDVKDINPHQKFCDLSLCG